jgi:diaminopimelate epimerase
MKLELHKYQGLGNDFIVVDAESDSAISPARASKLCRRHFGIGADGVLLVTPPQSGEARARMVVINADGSRPEMCGNGLRCVALHLARRDDTPAVSYVIDTDAGSLLCEVTRDGGRAQVRTDMGRGRAAGTHRESHAGRELEFSLVNMGNPHAITFDACLDLAAIDELAPRISAAFPAGSNVEFATARADGGYDLVVWERGVGRTLACGTGAAATAVAAQLAERKLAQPLDIHLPGGPLRAWVTRESLSVRLQGPAEHVFSGWTTL